MTPIFDRLVADRGWTHVDRPLGSLVPARLVSDVDADLALEQDAR